MQNQTIENQPVLSTAGTSFSDTGFNPNDMRETQSFTRRYGPWAIITGASSGIGEEFAQQLATLGMHLVLVARREDRLRKLADTLERTHGIHTRIVIADLAISSSTETIDEATRDLKIGLLINNAGAETHGAFLKQDVDAATRLVQLNAITPMQLAHRFGSRMADHGKGGIVFVSSMMGHQGVPYFANYAATKAYALVLGESLHYELKQQGVDVLVLSPGLTKTDIPQALSEDGVDFSRIPISLMTVEPVVRNTLANLGRGSGTIPGVSNKIMSWFDRRVLSRHQAAGLFGKLIRRTMPKHQL